MPVDKEEAPEIAQEQELPVYDRAGDYVEFYFNHAQVGYTGFDIYAFLSETAHDLDGKLHVRQKARVSMTPKEAKLFAFYLVNAVKKYEAHFGEVSVGDGMEDDDASQ